MATDEEVTQKRDAVADLRRQIAEAKADSGQDFRERQNDVTLVALTKQEEVLKAELASVTRDRELTEADVQARQDEAAAVAEASVEATQNEHGILEAPGDGPGFQARRDALEEDDFALDPETSTGSETAVQSNNSPAVGANDTEGR